MKVSNLILSAALSASIAACGSDFDPASRVTTTRILAVSADRPYAAPGEEVSLRALGHDPGGRPITWAYATCPNPSASTPTACVGQIVASAEKAGHAPTFAMGEGLTSFSFRVPDDALSSVPPEARAAAMVGIVVVACPGTLSLGASAEVPIRCTDATGRVLPLDEFDVGVKRVFVRAKDRNANPAIAQVTWDGAPWPEGEVKEIAACGDASTNDYAKCDGEKHDVAAITEPSSFESGVDELGGAFTEELVTQYYATEGIFEFPVRRADSPATGFVARKGASGRTIELFLVVRDSRGGSTWTTRTVRVR